MKYNSRGRTKHKRKREKEREIGFSHLSVSDLDGEKWQHSVDAQKLVSSHDISVSQYVFMSV